MTTITQPIVATDVEDGIYFDMPDATYRKIPRMNASTLEHGTETMADLKAAWDGKKQRKTKATELGKAIHCRLLEPARFKAEYAVKAQCEAQTQAKKQCSKWGVQRFDGHWFCDSHLPDLTPDPIETISEADAETLPEVVAAVHAHPAVAFLRQSGGCEVSIFWTDKKTGIKMKARIDKWIPECRLPGDGDVFPTILDLKKAREVDSRSLVKAIEQYGYNRRAAMYCDGIEALTGLRPDYMLVFILDAAPFHVRVMQLDEESIAGGRWEYCNTLAQWAGCLKSGRYPGYPRDIQPITSPDWKLKEYRKYALIEEQK